MWGNGRRRKEERRKGSGERGIPIPTNPQEESRMIAARGWAQGKMGICSRYIKFRLHKMHQL